MTTMLQLVQQVTAELGVSVPSAAATNTSQDIVQILALMNAGGNELMSATPWRALTKTHRFSTEYLTTTGTWTTAARTITAIPSTTGLDATYRAVATGTMQNAMITSVDSATQVTLDSDFSADGTAETVYFQKLKYALPSDYESIIPRTQWDRSKRWEMLGPEDAQQWELMLSGYISTGPRIRWRLLGSYFQIWPGLSATESLSFEYRSNGWAADSGGTAKGSFTVDTDTCIYADRLMVNMTKMKYFEAKGFDTTALVRDFANQLEHAMATDRSAANLSLAPRPASVIIGYDNIPDSGYGT